ncbi:MAG: glutathione S-transferase [Burkholderiales bacterium]|nr:glutathione S-transferase [Burkholderiales bacterium]
MIRLCGFPASNYYNKIKLALIEKGLDFQEEIVYPSQEEAMLAESPMGKVPFLRLGEGALAESQAIAEYLEDVHPQPPLYPRDAFQRAKVRELIEVMELHLELPARRLYGEAFFGGKASDEAKREVERLLAKGMRALGRIARFGPYIAGPEYTHADCAAIVHLPTVVGVTKTIYGTDPLATLVPAAPAYLKAMFARPASKTMNEARKAGLETFLALRKGAAPR